ncbi:hypothetical protein LZ554_007028 [Drepanopeziza brunnea f. sp. 'monogermtubi']|nr:hypothetical protein LZ554_007028 [Drepanopeziza brunnea f. sp. 'monogermtubi']
MGRAILQKEFPQPQPFVLKQPVGEASTGGLSPSKKQAKSSFTPTKERNSLHLQKIFLGHRHTQSPVHTKKYLKGHLILLVLLHDPLTNHFTTTIPLPIHRKKMSSHTSLSLPGAFKLKGAKNHQQWKDMVVNVANCNDIDKFLDEKSRTMKPKEVNEWDDDVKADELKIWLDWKTGESQMKLTITLNCKAGPLGHIQGKATALDMWEALQHQYEVPGPVLRYNAIQNHLTIVDHDFRSLEKFVVAFKLSIAKLESLGVAPPPEWHLVMFIAACSKKWPVWAERQRSNLRMANTKEKAEIALECLIEDLTLCKGR